jgi:YVTN family beta-propeller protein
MNRTHVAFLAGLVAAAPVGGAAFVNWETPHVHPLDMTPDGTKLLAVNTADARLEVFAITVGGPVHIGSVSVGLDPVTVRPRGNTEAWVVNHISDSISVVDLTTMNVVATISTLNEPSDVVFAGALDRAFVSCSQANTVQIIDPANLAAAPINVPIDAEGPQAMAVSPDGATVYIAVFESGNGSTILGGGADGSGTIGFPPNVVSDTAGPYQGVNPPPNLGAGFDPPQYPANPTPPAVGLIVKKDAGGRWMDDNDHDWTDLVSGPNAGLSGRAVGWDLPDHDLAVIDANSLSLSYVNRLMNICMAIAVNPALGNVTVVGTDATNEVRFEPVIRGRFTHVTLADVATDVVETHDLNPHLTYDSSSLSQEQRDLSIGDPRGIVWNAAGAKAYITGMGSNNVVVIDDSGDRIGLAPTIEVGEGPTGLVLDESRNRLYVLNKFAATISIVDTVTETQIGQVALFDPTPIAIKVGRKHLYDTRKNSGLGQMACASCHVDARMDRLAWDLGDPDGEMKEFNQNCNLGISLIGDPCEDWHPMKGPMVTQTLQDIIGKEPFHWRGDRDGLEEFNGAFIGLLGDDDMLTPEEMQEFERFLASIYFPPNPFRNFDNSLPTRLPLPGHFTTGRFGAAGMPLPNGNAVQGLSRYRSGNLDEGGFVDLQCVTCHTLPTGAGTNRRAQSIFGPFPEVPAGPNGEKHLALVTVDGSTNVSIKIPHLRNLYEKTGFNTTQNSNRAGFGYAHDGSIDSIERFVSEPIFNVNSNQDVADLVAFLLSFAGSDLPAGTTNNVFELLGPTSQDTHAAVGRQVTFDGANNEDPALTSLLDAMISIADANKVGLVGKGIRQGAPRGFSYLGATVFQSDRAAEAVSASTLRLDAADGEEITITVVPFGSQTRIGIDRDEDGYFDRDELDACSNPADSATNPNNVVITGDVDSDTDTDGSDFHWFVVCDAGANIPTFPVCRCSFDFDRDGDVDLMDFSEFQVIFTGP